MRRLVVSIPGPRVLTWLATSLVWAISAFIVFIVVFLAIVLAFNVDCARSGGGDGARRSVTDFQAAVGARDWNAACAWLSERLQHNLAEAARETHELSPTCTAGLQLAVRREKLVPGPVRKVSAPWLWDDATVTTTNGRYKLTTPDSNCDYQITELPQR